MPRKPETLPKRARCPAGFTIKETYSMVRILVALAAALAMTLSFVNVSAQDNGDRENAFISTDEAVCMQSPDGPLYDTLVYGTSIYSPLPPTFSSDQLHRLVVISDEYGRPGDSCWIPSESYEPGQGWVFYDGYPDPGSSPTFQEIGVTQVNSDSVNCRGAAELGSEVFGVLSYGAWVTMLDDGDTEDGWQYIVYVDSAGEHINCYVAEEYLGGIEETVQETEPEYVEEIPAVDPSQESEQDTWTDSSGADAVASEDLVESQVDASQFLALDATDGDPMNVGGSEQSVVTKLPNTGSGSPDAGKNRVLALTAASICCGVYATLKRTTAQNSRR